MIIDHISNRAFYYGLGDRYKEALDYFADLYECHQQLPESKDYDITLSANVSIRVRPMMTKNEKDCRIESHKKYADIHFVPAGIERIGYIPLDNLQLDSSDPTEDIYFWYGNPEMLTLNPGYFMIAFPQDGHMPTVCSSNPQFLLKLIAKIRL